MKPHILFFVPGMEITLAPIHEQACGGSETAGVSMAHEFANRGWDVSLFCNTPEPGFKDGVCYMEADRFEDFIRTVPADVVVAQRQPFVFTKRTTAKLNILWCHDLALIRQRDPFRGVLWNVDRVAVVSQFMADQYRDVYGMTDEQIMVTRNGIDLETIKRLRRDPPERNRNRIIYTSRPERGVDNLLTNVLPRVLKRNPEATLHLAAYKNTVEHMVPFYNQVNQLIRSHGDRVVWMGALSKEALCREYLEAGVLAYPTPSPTSKMFREVSCITAMEAMACGLPFVASALGALPETTSAAGSPLISGDPWSEDYGEVMADQIFRLMKDDAYHAEIAAAGIAAAESMSWAGIAAEWERSFKDMIRDLNRDPVRLAAHFYRHSEIEGAKMILDDPETKPTPLATHLNKLISKHYGFMDEGEPGFRRHYVETVGPYYDRGLRAQLTQDENVFEGMFKASSEVRFQYFEQFITKHGIETVLDYGCGHGWCDVYLHNRTGAKFLGVDLDPKAVEWQNYFASRYAREGAAVQAFEGDHTFAVGKPVDLLLISEVLEHCHDPVSVVRELEKNVRPGGRVLITVPYGPRELHEYGRLPFRNHVREYSAHDLRSLFGHRKDFHISYMFEEHCPVTGDACGAMAVSYVPDGTTIGEIDWKVKRWWQRPRQSVTAFMMSAGDRSEETLHWCLKSIRQIADRIVIADCGLSDEARRIARSYEGVQLFRSQSPQEVGFEAPRNAGLRRVDTDWALWIDDDEKLIGAQNVEKYLRENAFHAYNIQQHHFACDTSFKPDLPMRLFRNRPYKGRRPRFYGMIHEHPECGLNKGMGSVIVLADVHVAHVGYLAESIRVQRFNRNFPLLLKDEQKYPNRVLQKYLKMRDLSMLNMYEVRRNGGVLTESIRERCEEIKALYREHFLGKPVAMNLDPNDWYTDALQLLGEGYDVSFDFRTQREGVGDQLDGGKRMRYADPEEAMTDLTQRIKERFKPLEGDYF